MCFLSPFLRRVHILNSQLDYAFITKKILCLREKMNKNRMLLLPHLNFFEIVKEHLCVEVPFRHVIQSFIYVGFEVYME